MTNKPDITAPIIDNETWNYCPNCGKSWKDFIPTEGLLHRTKLCNDCSKLRGEDDKRPRSN